MDEALSPCGRTSCLTHRHASPAKPACRGQTGAVPGSLSVLTPVLRKPMSSKPSGLGRGPLSALCAALCGEGENDWPGGMWLGACGPDCAAALLSLLKSKRLAPCWSGALVAEPTSHLSRVAFGMWRGRCLRLDGEITGSCTSQKLDMIFRQDVLASCDVCGSDHTPFAPAPGGHGSDPDLFNPFIIQSYRRCDRVHLCLLRISSRRMSSCTCLGMNRTVPPTRRNRMAPRALRFPTCRREQFKNLAT